MREHLRQFDISVLDYCVTSNHVHLLVDATERLEVSGFMREVASEFARAYNQRPVPAAAPARPPRCRFVQPLTAYLSSIAP